MKENKETQKPNAVNEFSAFVRGFFSLFNIFSSQKKEDYQGYGNVEIIDLNE